MTKVLGDEMPLRLNGEAEASPAAEPTSAGTAASTLPFLPAVLVLAGVVCLFAAGSLLLRQSLRPAEFRIAQPVGHAEREAGFVLYRTHCSACHGAFLGGAAGWRSDPRAAPALNENGHASNHSDADLFFRVAAGARTADRRVTMPAFRGVLSDQEIVAVLAYVMSWWPQEELQRRAGADWTFQAVCTAAGAQVSAKAGL
ncbi:c-type cytochrome [Bosea sp. LjRoot90]|uniref:c-type cytochrome n=1 Tax=Bosea sp. LjRoot90 TaxID=3342342 RepID=UPI003ECDA7CF